MIKLISILAVLFLAGCGLTPQGDLIRGAIAEKGRQAAAQALQNAIWYKCRVSPVGAIQDHYGRSQTMAEVWRKECLGQGDVTLMGPVRLEE